MQYRRAIGHQPGASDRNKPRLEQAHCFNARPSAHAMPDRYVGVAGTGPDLSKLGCGEHAHLDAWVERDEPPKPRHKPGRGERTRRADGEGTAIRGPILPNCLDRILNASKRISQFRKEAPAVVSEANFSVVTP
jgi:hypothetical protein